MPVHTARLERRSMRQACLSFEQERLWFVDELEGCSVHHNDAFLVTLAGPLNVAALTCGIEQVIKRHEILRTAFIRDGENVYQSVHDIQSILMPIIDLPNASFDAANPIVDAAAREEMRKPLDLGSGQPLRTILFRVGVERHVLLLVIHHIVFDLWSFSIFVRELATFYSAFANDKKCTDLAELPVQYADFAEWQRSETPIEQLEESLRRRVAALASAPPTSTLPTTSARPAVQRFRGGAEWFWLDEELVGRLRTWSYANGVTLYMCLLTAFKTLIARQSEQCDLLVAIPISNRDPAELEQLIGCFVNMVIARTDLSGDPTFLEAAHRVREACLDAYADRALSFDRLIAALRPARTRSHQPVVQTAFVLQNVPMVQPEFSGLDVAFHEMDTGRARMDITIRVTECPNGSLQGELEYDKDLFSVEQMRALTRQFDALLRSALEQPNQPVWELSTLTAADMAQIVDEWNDTSFAFDGDMLIHRRFEAQAALNPGIIAVVTATDQITYRELNERANQLARVIRRENFAPENSVAVFLPRSITEIVAILAVMKAGGCYLPIDPRGPRARRESILKQANVSTILSTGDLSDEIWAPGRRVLDLGLEWSNLQEDSQDLGVELVSDNLAYTLFTSGTTGRPKGVMITHRGFLNRMLWAQRNFPLTTSDRVLRKAACTFDVSLDELFRALLNGATSVLMPDVKGFDPKKIADVIERNGVTDADFTPTALRELLASVEPTQLQSLRKIVSGVEALSADTQRLVLDSLDVTLFNLYGPTEVSVSATYWRCDSTDGRPNVPIGRPMNNVRCYVLDNNLRLTPPGQIGELFIGGAGLARGYLADPVMTAQRFIPDMLSGVSGSRLYRTGDLVRQDSNGVLEFLGRVDEQIKHLGYRIEPTEVAAAVREFPGISEAVVVSDGTGGDARLVAYVVSGSPVPAKELRSLLRERLPDYMVPTAYVRIDAVPLTAHGKLDRAALPPVPREVSVPNASFAAPRDEIEAKLAEIWCQVLHVDRIGIDESFFDLGGDSMQATRIVATARNILGADIGVAEIFDASTIAELAALFRSSSEEVLAQRQDERFR